MLPSNSNPEIISYILSLKVIVIIQACTIVTLTCWDYVQGQINAVLYIHEANIRIHTYTATFTPILSEIFSGPTYIHVWEENVLKSYEITYLYYVNVC